MVHDDIDALRTCLSSLGGKLVRRAVLVDHKIADKTEHPNAQEVEVLSRACESLRRAMRMHVYPRDTTQLLAECLRGNDPQAWEAVYADLSSDDLDLDATATTIAAAPAQFVRCLACATSETHLLAVCCVATLLDKFPHDAREAVGRELVAQLDTVVLAFSRIGLRRAMRDAALGALAKVLALTDAKSSRLADCLMDVLDRGKDDVTRLFVHVARPMVQARPQLLAVIVDRAEAAKPGHRYGLLAILAKVLTHHVDRVTRIVLEEMQYLSRHETPDARGMLACAMLARCSPDPMISSLAACLEIAAGALVS